MKLSPDLASFLREAMPAIVGTARRDGSVQMKPIWYELRDDGEIWVNGMGDRRWLARARRTGQLALFFIDPRNMWRHATIHCRVVTITTEGADDHIDRLSERYVGTKYRNPKIQRTIVRLEPIHVSGIDGGKPWRKASEEASAAAS